MVWGVMTKNKTVVLYFLVPGTTTNVLKYVQLLQEKLNIHMVMHNTSIFMYDGRSTMPQIESDFGISSEKQGKSS